MKKEIILEKDISEGIVERSYNREQTIKIINLEEEIQDKEIPYIKKEKKFLVREMEKESESTIPDLIEKKALEMIDMKGDFIPDDQNIKDQDLRIREKKKKKIKKKKREKERDEGREIKYF